MPPRASPAQPVACGHCQAILLTHLIQEGVALSQGVEGQEEEKGWPLLQLVVQQEALPPVGSQPVEEGLPVLQGPLPNVFSSEIQGFMGIELKGEELVLRCCKQVTERAAGPII